MSILGFDQRQIEQPRENHPSQELEMELQVHFLTGERKKFSCLLCKGNHQEWVCTVVTNIEERKVMLRRQGRPVLYLFTACESRISDS